MSPRPVLCPLCIDRVVLTADHANSVHSDAAERARPASPALAYELARRIQLDDNLDRPERLRHEHTMGQTVTVNIDRCDVERPPAAADPMRVRSLTWEAARIIGAPHGRDVYEDLILLDRSWEAASGAAREAALEPIIDIIVQLRAILRV